MAENNQSPGQLDSDKEDRRTSATRTAPSDRKCFADVDKIVQRLQTREDIIALQSQQPQEVLEDLLAIARVVQILAASPSSAPTSSSQDQDLETQPEPPRELTTNFGHLTDEEIGLLNLIRSKGLSADKLTIFLTNAAHDPYPLRLVQLIRE